MSHVTLGLWPIAGITTVGVTESDAKATIAAAIECGITSFDTAFSYGYQGQSDRLLGTFVREQRDRYQVIGKVGQRWNHDRRRVIDGSPKTITADAETSLERIGIDQFDLLMLHSPDRDLAIERSAEALVHLRERGLCREIGVCNVDADQLRRFADCVPCAAIQCPLNLVQRESLQQLIPQCKRDGIEVYAFWGLMKGLLAGRISRHHRFAEGDVRPGYEIFQGTIRQRIHDILDGMQVIAGETGKSIAQLSIGWVLSQPGVTAALVGARRPQQVRETSTAAAVSDDVVQAIDNLVRRAGLMRADSD